jgi:hypothetical protein
MVSPSFSCVSSLSDNCPHPFPFRIVMILELGTERPWVSRIHRATLPSVLPGGKLTRSSRTPDLSRRVARYLIFTSTSSVCISHTSPDKPSFLTVSLVGTPCESHPLA